MSDKSSEYFLVVNGVPQGPYNLTQLKEFVIKPGDFLKTPAMDDYKEAHEIAEIRELLGFKKEALIPQYFGSFDQRLLASLLDWFFLFGVFAFIALIITLFTSDNQTRLTIIIACSLFVPPVKMIYHTIMESSVKQGTFGKQILKIRVCDLNGERIGFALAIGRNLAKILSSMPFFIGYVFCFFNKKQQCLHDMVAGTLVMKDRLF